VSLPRIASPATRSIEGDAVLRTGVLSAGTTVSQKLCRQRGAYVISTDAAIDVNGHPVDTGDRLLAVGPGLINVRALGPTEVVLLDVSTAT
jgi:hypothetical protein